MSLPVKGKASELDLKPEVKLVRVRKRLDPNPARLLVAQRNLEAVQQAREGLLWEDPSRLPREQTRNWFPKDSNYS